MYNNIFFASYKELIAAANIFFTDCIKYRFGPERFSACEPDLGERLNQKCRDTKRKIKKE
jgi:hypothetical protein